MEPLVNVISNLPLGLELGNLLKRRIDGIKAVPAKKEKMFCGLCDKIYTSKHHLQRHIFTKHMLSCNTCEECHEIFGTQSSLSKHRKTCGKSRASAKKEHQKTRGKDEVVCNLQSASDVARSEPKQWCPDNSAYRKTNGAEESLRKAAVQQTSGAQLGGVQGSSGNNPYQNHCKLCLSEGPFYIVEHYLQDHHVPDPLSMLCSDRTFLVLTATTATKHLGDDAWWGTQFARAVERYTDTVCRLCEKDLTMQLSTLGLSDHYARHHKVDCDLLCVTRRLLREDGAIVVTEAQTSQQWRS